MIQTKAHEGKKKAYRPFKNIHNMILFFCWIILFIQSDRFP